MRSILEIGCILTLIGGGPGVELSVRSVGDVAGVGHAYAGASLPPLTVCAAPEWVTINPTSDSVAYLCRSVCPAQDGSQCTYPTSDRLGNSLQAIAFVVDSMGGEIRWNTPPEIVAGVLLHDGDDGALYASGKYGRDIRQLWVDFGNEGVRLVEPKWQPGHSLLGWFSRKDGTPTTLPALTARPAAVIQWARTYLIPSGVKLGTVGCSAGSIATFGAVYWHGLAPIIDYEYLTGALPGAYDIPATCSGRRSPSGICENDPASSCTSDASCDEGYRCAIPQATGSLGSPVNPVAEQVKVLIDYVAVTGGRCVAGQRDPAFYLSSFKYVPGDASFDHPVDTNVAVGGSPVFLTDTSLGVTYNTASLYTSILTTPAKTYDLTTGEHCESIRNPLELPKVLNKIRTGLGFTPLPPPSVSP